MERNEILAKLTPIFRTAFNDDTIELDEDMTTDDFDNWDSVTQMIIVSMIEKEFDIVFKLREVGMLDSVEAFVDGIEEKLA
ncbi:acyl carrier protein [Segatella hominis]|jgi:acyl carrier protein|uniref:acyl carrier protein n=1 Tax=Segatella hominis TaxID=2518605 RepID=UPI003AAE8AC7